MLGLQIICSEAAVKDSETRLFPMSRHRSRRIHKKLLKRFGGEFVKVPCVYRLGDKFVAHPAMYARLQQEIAAKQRSDQERAFMSVYAGRNPW